MDRTRTTTTLEPSHIGTWSFLILIGVVIIIFVGVAIALGIKTLYENLRQNQVIKNNNNEESNSLLKKSYDPRANIRKQEKKLGELLYDSNRKEFFYGKPLESAIQ